MKTTVIHVPASTSGLSVADKARYLVALISAEFANGPESEPIDIDEEFAENFKIESTQSSGKGSNMEYRVVLVGSARNIARLEAMIADAA